MTCPVYRIPVVSDFSAFEKIVRTAGDVVNSGGIIAGPSDTIYGFFCSYRPDVINKLHKIKERSPEKPFLLLVPPDSSWQNLVSMSSVSMEVRTQLEKLWPGKNTCILPKDPSLSYPPGNTIALRMPRKSDNMFLGTLLEITGALAAPSLNASGDPPMKSLEEITQAFGESIDSIFYDPEFIPDSGPSAIWDCTDAEISRVR